MLEAMTAAKAAGVAVEKAAQALEAAPITIKAMAGKELKALSDALRLIHSAQVAIIAEFGGRHGK